MAGQPPATGPMTPGSPPSRARDAFVAAFGAAPLRLVRAPGRVNLIGEHTDYNGGFVLPCAIDFDTVVAVSPRRDRQVRVVAADQAHAQDGFTIAADIAHRPDAPWADYVRGMAQVLQRAGVAPAGADLAIAGNVPQGAGLSSSASLSVSLGMALIGAGGAPLPSRDQLARLAQQVENEFVGVHCGLMDQLASACAVAGHALLIDCGRVALRPVPMPREAAVMIVHSGVQRGLVGSAYNVRRQQCEAVARHFGVAAVCDLDPARLDEVPPGLDPLALRRARHAVSDSARAVQAAEALATGDLVRLGALMAASHASMRDDFEITTPEIDRLAALAQAAIGEEGGARMTGGGFGGCVVAVLPRARVDDVQSTLLAGYRTPQGRPPALWVTGAASGAGWIPA